MNAAEQSQILEQFDKLVKQEGSQNKASIKVGINPAIISTLRKGTYTGDSNLQFEKLASYFNVKQEASYTYEEVNYVATSISEKVYEIIRNCQVKGGLAIACGDAGIGKSKAAKQFLKEHLNDCLYFSVNPCLTSIKSLLKLIANRLGATSEKTLDELWLVISSKLRDGMVIIIDEAQHLPIKTIETLRSFTDYFADMGQTLGIVFIGNQETVRKLGSKQQAEFAQINNRTKQKMVYTTKQIKKDDIKMLFPILADKNMDAEIDFLLSIAQTQQAIRGATNLFSNAYDNENYSYKGLVAMAKHMEMAV